MTTTAEHFKPAFFRINDATEYLGVSRSTIYRMIERGDLVKYTRGGIVRLKRSQVEACLIPEGEEDV